MSIQRRLLILIIATITLASFFAAIQGYKNSRQQLDQVFDHELSTMAHFILSSYQQYPPNAKASLDEAVEPVVMPSAKDFVFQVYQADKLLSQSVLSPSKPIATKENTFSENSFNGTRWRTYWLKRSETHVMVAHPIAARAESAEAILLVTISPILYSIPIIALIVLYIISKSLKPLRILSYQLTHKSMDDLTAVQVMHSPSELVPVISRINHLFTRLGQAFEREKQLTANAAHELRTPVSVLSLSAHNLREDFKHNALSEQAFIELQDNVERMAHVTEQIIALYRYTPENFHSQQSLIEIEVILQDVISKNYSALYAQNQNIVLESTPQYILGEKFALFTLFENLLKNSIKYSGENADIHINMSVVEQQVSITFEDSGPGVSDAELDLIFDRFYRAHAKKSRIKGSGLGLSIVKHIVDLHQGSISCSRSSLGGLAVSIKFALLETLPS